MSELDDINAEIEAYAERRLAILEHRVEGKQGEVAHLATMLADAYGRKRQLLASQRYTNVIKPNSQRDKAEKELDRLMYR